MPKVSVIMPSLNVASYIEECIESVINQTLKDIEIIAVDAGSTDGTLEILKKYESQDSRVHVVHSEKKSYGFQMNLGISKAKGEYIGVVETDDYVEPNMYEVLYNQASDSRADYVKGSAERFWAGRSEPMMYTNKIRVFSDKEFAENQGVVTINPGVAPELIFMDYYLWTGIYRSDFIKTIKLNETPGAAYQDIGFLFQTFYKAQKAVYLDKIFYHYRQDNPNASIYNRNSFHYIIGEYSYVDGLLQNQDEIWHTLSCCKMFRQTNQRVRLMAISGSVWDSALSDLQIISARLKQRMIGNNTITEYISPKEWLELELLMKNPIELYDYYVKNENEKRSKLSMLLKNFCTSHQTIVFGAGYLGKFVHTLLEFNGIERFEAYCDNNSNLWGCSIQGKAVISPEEAVKNFPQAAYVIANQAHHQEIKDQLMSMGINETHIFTYSLEVDMLFLNKAYLYSK
ncbi:glycosyltransferase [Paenibacillus xylanexedens]|uniref:glycosyltransferase n=1 Tax=Paenibacillus xylanexedens TaxID=528191 RepID=UPI00119EBA00|nr:glycosyltransferase [Paenibacillus xylanexedens]